MENNVNEMMLKRPTLDNVKSRRKYAISLNSQELSNHINKMFESCHNLLNDNSKSITPCSNSLAKKIAMKNGSIPTATSIENHIKSETSLGYTRIIENNNKVIINKNKMHQTISFEQSCGKISNFFDKTQVQDSILRHNSIEKRLKAVDYIIQRRDELKNIASIVALQKTAPVLKDFRHKFKQRKNTILGQMIPNNQQNSLQAKKSTILLKTSTNNISDTKFLEISPHKKYISRISMQLSPRDCSIIVPESTSGFEFIETNRVSDPATAKSKRNLKLNDSGEGILNRLGSINENPNQLSPDDINNYLEVKTHNHNRKSTTEELENSSKNQANHHSLYRMHSILSRVLKKPLAHLRNSQLETSPEEQFTPHQVASALEYIWAFESHHGCCNGFLHEKGKHSTKQVPDFIKVISKTLSQVRKRKEEDAYKKFAQKRLEKDLIKYSVKHEDEMIINPNTTSNNKLKQIEKQAKLKFKAYQTKSENQIIIPKKIKQDDLDDDMLFNRFLNNLETIDDFDQPTSKINLEEKDNKIRKTSKEKVMSSIKTLKNLTKQRIKSPSYRHFNLIKNPDREPFRQMDDDSFASVTEFKLDSLYKEMNKIKKSKDHYDDISKTENLNDIREKNKIPKAKPKEADILDQIRKEIYIVTRRKISP